MPYDDNLAAFLMRSQDTSWDAIRAQPERALGEGLGLADLVGLGGWMRGETKGRPGFAPGPLYDAIPDILGWIDPKAKAASIGTVWSRAPQIAYDAYRTRQALREAGDPRLAALDALGGPIDYAKQKGRDAWEWLRGHIPEMPSIREPSPAYASVEPKKFPDLEYKTGADYADAGYLRLKYDPDHEKYVTDIITTRKPSRGQGVASGMLDEAARELGYAPEPEVILGNKTAPGFWKSKGWDRGYNQDAWDQGISEIRDPALTEQLGGYSEIIPRILGKHGIITPYIPKNVTEPLLIKTPSPNVAPLAKGLLTGGRDYRTASGMFIPLWNEHENVHPKISGLGGEILLSSLRAQERTIPHETSHLLSGRVAGRGAPDSLVDAARSETAMSNPVDIGVARKQLRESLADTSPFTFQHMESTWPKGTNIGEEILAETVNPSMGLQRWATHLPEEERVPFAQAFRSSMEKVNPRLKSFWDTVPNYIHPDAYSLSRAEASDDIIEALARIAAQRSALAAQGQGRR